MTTHLKENNMKVHNDLKELLEEYTDIFINQFCNNGKRVSDIINDFTSSNSLALGKPEPLAKNKQTQEFKCNYCKDQGFILMVPLHGDYMTTKADCPYCTKRADATSR